MEEEQEFQIEMMEKAQEQLLTTYEETREQMAKSMEIMMAMSKG